MHLNVYVGMDALQESEYLDPVPRSSNDLDNLSTQGSMHADGHVNIHGQNSASQSDQKFGFPANDADANYLHCPVELTPHNPQLPNNLNEEENSSAFPSQALHRFSAV
jgi:hypothetical protein